MNVDFLSFLVPFVQIPLFFLPGFCVFVWLCTVMVQIQVVFQWILVFASLDFLFVYLVCLVDCY